MKPMQILLILASAASTAVLCRYHLHMFQLNSYKIREELHWIKLNIGSLLGRVLGLILALPLIVFAGNGGLAIAILLHGLTILGNLPRQTAKIPLAYTMRIRRIIATTAVLYLFLLTVCLLASGSLLWTALLATLLGAFSVLLVLLANQLNQPLERGITRRYVEEARTILRKSPGLKIVGITGSYGKTSMKYFLHTLLSSSYQVLMTPGNFNTTLGVVRTIREQLKPTHQIFLCEMGARNEGDIQEICDLVHPGHGVLTSIGPQHLESFGTLETIIRTKFELVRSVPQDGMVFLNWDNQWIAGEPYTHDSSHVVTYGLHHPEAQFQPKDLITSKSGSSFQLRFPDGSERRLETRLIGTHNVLNIIGAVAVAYHLGVGVDEIARQVRLLKPVPHRLELLETPRGIIIDDAYNSNPEGAKAALETLQSIEGTRFLVTPGMVELGEQQDQLNYEFGKQAALAADYIILVGERQTRPIQQGIRDQGFEENRLIIAGSLKDAMAKVDAINTGQNQKVILLENDLPDNY